MSKLVGGRWKGWNQYARAAGPVEIVRPARPLQPGDRVYCRRPTCKHQKHRLNLVRGRLMIGCPRNGAYPL